MTIIESPHPIQKIKNYAELIGIIAIVISLFLVLQELRQSRQIALGEFDMEYTQNRLLANQQITDYPELWISGCRGDDLNETEEVIFRQLVINENDLAVFKVSQALRLGDQGAANAQYTDFAGWLHRNPGAYRVWMEREQTLLQNRQAMQVISSTWYRDVQYALDRLEGN